MAKLPISILIPTKNEEKNISRCLAPILDWADEIVIVDSGSTDRTKEIVEQSGCQYLLFEYKGGWPKKRQWALDNYPFKNPWILLLDSDEILLSPVKKEIEQVIGAGNYDGYWLRFQIHFLGKMLKHGDTELWKLSLFRNGLGRYEKRMDVHDESMADMEIHEHVIVKGDTSRLKSPVRHENYNSLDRYIHKHNEYSNWEVQVYFNSSDSEVKPYLFGNQAERRRYLKRLVFSMPFSYLVRFFYLYVLKLGFLDGRQGFYHAGFKSIQYFHIRAKKFEYLNSQPHAPNNPRP
ncbi:MAG: glycosyltransferase family 2 protein [Bacteroidota bacterium]